MFTTKRIVLTCAFLLAVICAWWMSNRPEQIAVSVPAEQAAEKKKPVVVLGADDDDNSLPPERSYDETLPTSADNCLTPSQLETHPLVTNELATLEPLIVLGESMEAYRGLSRANLIALANQNDSAAMAVLGAMAVLRGKNTDEAHAVSYLRMRDFRLRSSVMNASPAQNADEEYQRAIDWFYKSAMHGRLFSMGQIGATLDLMESNPIKHGAVTQKELDAMTKEERAYFSMTAVYMEASMHVAGYPTEGILGQFSKLPVFSEVAMRLSVEIAEQFVADQMQAGLPPVHIPTSTMPPMEEFIEMLCEDYRPD